MIWASSDPIHFNHQPKETNESLHRNQIANQRHRSPQVSVSGTRLKPAPEHRSQGLLRKQNQRRLSHSAIDGGGNMNSKTIEIVIGTKGEIQIDAVGFKGPDCEKATAFLEGLWAWWGRKSKGPSIISRAPGQINRISALERIVANRLAA
jgi:hypothetical protein